MKFGVVFLILCVCVNVVIAFDHHVDTHCNPDDDICEFQWTLDYMETMVYYENVGGQGDPVVVRNGSLFRRLNCDEYVALDINKDMDKVVTADGTYKLIYAINGQVPGPSLVAYEGQTVIVHLKNNLLMEGITIHWHGMVQRNTPWMDGVATISHCPINPGESFEYRFLASPAGTHWYHSHLGTERTDGLSGALIILPKPEINKVKLRSDLPDFVDDYAVVLSDWKLDHSVEVRQEITWGLTRYSYGFNNSVCYSTTSEADGGGIGLTLFESGLINGKGQHYLTNDNPDQAEVPEMPTEVFEVKRYNYYRLRVINTGMLFAFRFSIDGHDIGVISVDGNDVAMEGAESIVIHTGERVDIALYASANVGNYWIRAETLEESNTNGETVVPGRVLGILHYEGAPERQNPSTKRKVCRRVDPCKVINCAFGVYTDTHHIDCLPISALKSTEEEIKRHPVPQFTTEEEFQEVFLNFHFSSSATVPFTSAVNGHNFVPPTSPPQIYPEHQNTLVSCDDLDCTDHCHCTYIVKLETHKTVQVVIVNQDDAVFGMPHPVHMHGHHFHVVKIGYPSYNKTTGRILGSNEDIGCNTPSCNAPFWKNETWNLGNVPGINLKNPPLKDTIIVPRNGYVVLRLKSDNPGFWFMHCHIEVHQIAGMAVLLQEGDTDEMAPVPEGYPTCGSFQYQNQDIIKETRKTDGQNHIENDKKFGRKHHHHGHHHYDHRERHMVFLLLGLSVILNLIFIVIIVFRKRKNNSKHPKHWFSDNLKKSSPMKKSKDLSESKQVLI